MTTMEDMAGAIQQMIRVPSTLKHRFVRSLGPLVGNNGRGYTGAPKTEDCKVFQANLVSSRLESGMHAPVLDIDFPAALIPSSTPGHYHLYLDKAMAWKEYKKLLEALAQAGIIEWGFYDASVAQGQSTLRVPWVKK